MHKNIHTWQNILAKTLIFLIVTTLAIAAFPVNAEVFQDDKIDVFIGGGGYTKHHNEVSDWFADNGHDLCEQNQALFVQVEHLAFVDFKNSFCEPSFMAGIELSHDSLGFGPKGLKIRPSIYPGLSYGYNAGCVIGPGPCEKDAPDVLPVVLVGATVDIADTFFIKAVGLPNLDQVRMDYVTVIAGLTIHF